MIHFDRIEDGNWGGNSEVGKDPRGDNDPLIIFTSTLTFFDFSLLFFLQLSSGTPSVGHQYPLSFVLLEGIAVIIADVDGVRHRRESSLSPLPNTFVVFIQRWCCWRVPSSLQNRVATVIYRQCCWTAPSSNIVLTVIVKYHRYRHLPLVMLECAIVEHRNHRHRRIPSSPSSSLALLKCAIVEYRHYHRC